jgi:branched-subunit amino acid aminotransferase/4-amino-4-deoxychorismate lyase
MPDVTWINGEFFDPGTARISASDAGLLHAVGLFETMLGAHERVFRIDRHLARLIASARDLRLADALRPAPLAEAVHLALERSGYAQDNRRARIRLTITGGDLNMLRTERRGPTDPTVIIAVTPALAYPERMFTEGVGVLIASAKSNPFDPTAGHKTLNYWWRLSALQEAARAGMGESLILQATNHLAGGAVSNVFLVRNARLLTPLARGEEPAGALASPVLPGITRDAIMEFAAERSLIVERRMLTVADALDADEIFLTNASWGILPVINIEAKIIAAGTPGPITRALRDRWLTAVRDET